MIRNAVDSVLAQRYSAIELIIVDDGSTDNTYAVLQQLQAAHPDIVRCFTQENCGPGVARNLGLKYARGEFIQYLDSDDILHPNKFQKQVESLGANPDAGVSYCVTLRCASRTGEMIPWARTAETIENIFPSFLPKRGWATLTPLWRRSVCDAIGPWKPYRVMEDWEHDLRAGILGVIPVHVPEALCTVVDHDENRASGMNEGFTPERIRDFFRAHESIWKIMRDQNLTDWSYLQQFSRTMFWIGRMCGRFGLNEEAEASLTYMDEMTSMHGLPSATRRFRQLKSLLGWKASVMLSEKLAAVPKRVRG